ncbi:MAG: hypothetical protein U0Q16_02190 [Bryobacteraceae bacterium]
MINFREAVATLLAILLLQPAQAQQRASAAAAAASTQTQLRIFVLEGEGAVNVASLNVFTPPVVEVRDSNDRLVERAEVTFHLPPTGAGAFFPNQETSKTVLTNLQGQAAASGFKPNSTLGKFKIRVTAKHGLLSGEASINQSNQATLPSPHKGPTSRVTGFGWKKWVAIAAAGGAAGAILGTRKGSSSSPTAAAPPTVVITPGAPVFGGR